MKVHRTVLTWSTNSGTPWLVSSTVSPIFGVQAFNFSQFNDYTEYASVFDQYKLEMIEVTIHPRSGAPGTGFDAGLLTSVIDLNDVTAPVSLPVLQDYATQCTTRGWEGQIRTFRPAASQMYFYSGGLTGYGPAAAPWLDTASSAVQHFGLKVGITATTTALSFDVTVRALLAFRANR